MEETSLNPKVKANAVSAYLLVFVSFLFLFNKTNKYINNDFVKNHTKTAFFLHLMLLFTYIIFILLVSNYYIKIYASSILFLGIFGLMLLGMYKAHKEQTFKIVDIVKISKVENVADLQKHIENDENQKFSFFLSYIPFLSYMNYSLLNSNLTYNKVFKNNIYINLIISFIISIIYISGNPTLALFILLVYIIIIVFISVILVIQNNFIFIYINHLNKLEYLGIYIKTSAEYFKNYTKTNFIPIKQLLEINITKELSQNTADEALLRSKNDSKLTRFLIYIPIINLIYLFSLGTKYRFHIINGISLTIITGFLIYFYRGFDVVFFLLLYPISFGIGNLKGKLAYKLPIIYHIYNIFVLIVNKIRNMFRKFKETKNTIKKSEFKIQGDIDVGGKKITDEVREGEIVEQPKIEVKEEKIESPTQIETK